MGTFKERFKKYLDKLKGVDLTTKTGTLKSNISTCVTDINNLKGTISSSTWKEMGEESLSNSVIPSVQTSTSGLSSNIDVLDKAASGAKELVSIIEELKTACDNYDAVSLEDYSYTDSSGNKQYHYSEYNSKKESLRKIYEPLEQKADAKISELKGLTVTDLNIDIASLFATDDSIVVVDDTELADLDLTSSGGHYVENVSKGISGYIISSLDGKKHVIFRQSQISGWGTNCNRAAAASIASAFTNNPWDAITAADQVGNGIGYSKNATNKYFGKFGLSASITLVNGNYDKIKSQLASNLSRGNYVMFDLDDAHVKGKSGQTWTSTRHWLAVLDIKKTGSGPNDYAIFISDSGHSGSRANYYGLGAGWYRLDEFSGLKVKNFTVVKKTGVKI